MSRRERSREALLDAATSVLAENPGVSLSEVATRAGIGRATLYRHFPSREVLIRELALRSIAEIDRAMEGVAARSTSALDYFQQMMEALVPLGDHYHFLTREWHTLTDPVIRQALDRQMRGLEEVVDALKREGVLAADVPSAWVASAIDALTYAAWQSVRDGWVARREAAGLATRTVLNGLGPGTQKPDPSNP